MAFLISKWARMPMTSQVNGTKNGCIMKNFNKIFFAAVAAAFGLASCSQELTPVEKPQGNLVTVNFGAEASITCPTKATLTTEDEKLFTSAWENGDALSVKYSFDYGVPKETTATWSADKSCFEAQLEGGNGIWIYDALYPTPKEVSFGSERTQNGSNYNGKYDLMYGSATAEGADAGKTADGKNIVFKMTRQTAVAYFHLTGTLDEEVVSAKLSVEGDGAYISTSDVKANEDYAKGYVFTETEGVASKEINLTFDAGTAPKASDFKLWFNVLPTIYTKMTLTVETANHTMTISRTAADMYEAGKLYKVVKAIPADKWVKKEGETPAAASWIATDLADITATDEVVITMAKGERVYALTSAKGSKDAPTAVAVTVENKELTAAPEDNLVWNIVNDNENLTIYPKGQTAIWLYTTNNNNGVRVGTNSNKSFIIDSGYLKNITTNRYLGVYNGQDWRCYTSTTTNIGGQTLCFYVKGDPIDNTIPTLSVDQTSKTWAADATDAFVVKVTVNSEGGDWTVTPETLSWATIVVDKTAGTITVTPNGANETETANEATLTVTHASDASLTKEISLKQNAAGGGETPKTYTLQFGKTYNSEGISSYAKSWTVTCDGFTWDMVNWNNNQNGWTYVKAGSNKNASVATITTKTTMPEAISTVTMTIDEINATYVNSIKLEVLSVDGNTVKETITGTKVKGDCVFKITNPQQDCKYKITVDCKQNTAKNGKNGFVQVSKVVYTNF